MTRDEFRKKYRLHLIGAFFNGSVAERKEGTLERAARIDAIPADVDHLLNLMFNDLIGPDKPPPSPSGNGQAQSGGKTGNGNTTTGTGHQVDQSRR